MSGTRSKKFRPKPSGSASASVRRRFGVLWMLPALGLALAVVIGLAVVARHRSSGPPAGSSARDSGPIPAEVSQGLTGIPMRTFDAAAARGARRPSLVAPGRQSAVPAAVLYIGAEYCPYCAALRWPLLVALARFGSFTGLALSRSSATDVFPGTPTFTFLTAQYHSPNLTLTTVELQGNVADATSRYPLLQRPTSTQAAVSALQSGGGDPVPPRGRRISMDRSAILTGPAARRLEDDCRGASVRARCSGTGHSRCSQ